MRRHVRAIVLGLLASGPFSTLAAQDQAPPTFRARADVVTVNVSVRSGNRPVEGLDAPDFTLLDDGVPQTVATTTTGSIPLDVTFLYGVGLFSSGNVRQFRTDVERMAQLLGPSDRLRVLQYGTRVAEAFPLQPSNGQSVAAHLDQFRVSVSSATGGWTALHDALAAALIAPTSPERRQLVVAFYDGPDTISITSPARLQAVAKRTEAVLHVQLFQTTVPTMIRGVLGPLPFLLNGFDDALHEKGLIMEVAEMTGGGAYGPGLFGRSIVDFFRNVLADYRQSYLLQYKLTGVPHEGWHDITVNVTRPGKYDVRARRGYFVDANR